MSDTIRLTKYLEINKKYRDHVLLIDSIDHESVDVFDSELLPLIAALTAIAKERGLTTKPGSTWRARSRKRPNITWASTELPQHGIRQPQNHAPRNTEYSRR